MLTKRDVLSKKKKKTQQGVLVHETYPQHNLKWAIPLVL